MLYNFVPMAHPNALDGLRAYVLLESAVLDAYDRHAAHADPEHASRLDTVRTSHRNRLILVQATQQRHRNQHGNMVDAVPRGSLASLLEDWRTADGVIALIGCERQMLNWYHEESKRRTPFLAQLVADRLMPEQARTCTIMGGLTWKPRR